MWDNPYSHQCSRRGVLEEDGMLWCRQHAPSTVRRKRREEDQAWDEKQERWARREAMRKARHNITEAAIAHVTEAREGSLEDLGRVVHAYLSLLASDSR